jgi:hypothetical protein
VLKVRFFMLATAFATIALCVGVEAIAQKENVFLHPQKFYKKYFPNVRIKRDPPDTLFIKSYPNYLSASILLLSPSVRYDIMPRSNEPEGKVAFRTNVADILGAVINYRYVSAGFAFLLNSGMRLNSEYAKSKYRTATIKYNSRGYNFQFKYIRIKGMTDVNVPSDFYQSQGYIKRPDIVTKEFQFENTYNPAWRKYSFSAPFTFSERQIKSYGGFLFKTGIYYSQMSGDSSLIDPTKLAHYSNDMSMVNAIRSLSIRLAPGAGGNLIVRDKYYASMSVFPSFDVYFYKYLENTDGKSEGSQTLAFAFEGNASVGYQSRRMYAGIRCELENSSVLMRGMQSRKLNTSIGLEFGYRFNAPRFVKKVYRDTMPPGM